MQRERERETERRNYSYRSITSVRRGVVGCWVVGGCGVKRGMGILAGSLLADEEEEEAAVEAELSINFLHAHCNSTQDEYGRQFW